MEISALEQSVERYRDKYGDYPPDFSSWVVIERHYRKIFPRIAQGELDRLRLLLDIDTTNDTNTSAPGTWPAHNAAAMDRGEALVWTLGGYSKNPINPFTGPGGPLELVATSASAVVYQINVDRPEKIHPFDPARLDYSDISSAAAVSATNRYLSSDGDLFPTYAVDEEGAPFVYFDSRTYAFFDPTLADFNGYGSTVYGFVRPYYSTLQNANTTGANYGTLANALGAWQFINPDSFQIVAPGLDGKFGSFAAIEFDGSSGGQEPLYFQYPSGRAIAPSTAGNTPGDLLVPGIRGFQESSKFNIVDDFQIDNVSSFSRAKLVDDLKE
jgi:hypothetical protein